MKKIISLICAACLLPAAAWATDPAIEFVHELSNQVIEDVLKSNGTPEKKLERFRGAFTEALDLKSIGQFVLGFYWRNATAEQREEFLDAFVDFTTKTWADRFDMYTGQKIVFLGARNADQNQLFVDSQIQDNPPVEVIWRLRQKDGKYHIIDIIIEGVSMVVSYRNEYGAFLQARQGNLSALTEELQRKSAAFQFSSEKK